ncbi:hypothetical protein OHC33_006542 [Knufia fluminis]|uniref:Enoyl reductase (ER) domain-containing protein n=1 Tax=Knufia fluminis TaxID=191047 RepID=A0AAN8EUP3_9EURO|nr:hypothetical protein OHC33_006542 [Knufia fluminis]
MSKQHNAVYLDGKGKEFRVGPIDTQAPGKGQVLIRNKAVAINPVDWKIQDIGFYIDSWPTVLGEDLAGEIVEVGEGVTRFKTGQRVLAHSNFLITRKLQDASFQDLVLVPEAAVSAIPDRMKYEDATALPLAVSTAAAGLYQSKKEICLELDPPSTDPKKSGKTLLVWGGSSSVGTAAIQLAVASGLDVVTTCSKRNFDLVDKLGAKPFDYNSPSIVGDLVAELQKGSFVGAYDSIGTRESSMQAAQVVVQFGGGILSSVLPPPEDVPASVQAKQVFAVSIFYGENAHVGKAVYEDFLPKALASGQIMPAPPSEVVGHGLDAIQEACKKQKAGVSAKKIVVTL